MIRALELLAILRTDGILSGLANCHVPDVYSFVLSERQNNYIGMVRIFYAPKGVRLTRDIDDSSEYEFVVAPHNHRQDITLAGLFGCSYNFMFSEESDLNISGSAHRSYRHEFESGIIGGSISTKNMTPVGLIPVSTNLIDSNPIFIRSSDIHTVGAISNSAWLVEEGRLAENFTSYCYTRLPRFTPDDGLYGPVPSAELPGFANLLAEQIEQATKGAA